MTIKFESKILSIGEDAADFKEENIVIFFGQRANGGLEDYSLIIEEPQEKVVIEVGDVLHIGQQSYPVTAVGEKVWETFSTLGHFTARFDGADTPVLHGTVHLAGEYPTVQVGDTVIIEARF